MQTIKNFIKLYKWFLKLISDSQPFQYVLVHYSNSFTA
jgi:hypothetical protein